MKPYFFLILSVLIGSPTVQSADYPWQESQAHVLPTGDLQWKPLPYVITKGESVRYIDFSSGDDHNDGTTPEQPWKHHPWDEQAKGKAKDCAGIHTYVFKGGVTYRGRLVASESGTAGNPIRLVRDPSWGNGPAVLSGSDIVSGWEQGYAHVDIPDADRVWSAQLDWAPRMIWMVKDGEITNIPLARTPNWAVSEPEDTMSEWFVWENPKWWKRENVTTTVGNKKMKMGTDRKNLTEDSDYYQDAIIWSEWSVVMGTPYPSKVEAVPSKGQLAFQGMWWGTSTSLRTGHRYFLEDKPHYLDSAGEYWFDKKDEGGTLYIRLPGDIDPNTVIVEAARRYGIIEDEASNQAPKRLDVLREKKNDPGIVSPQGISHVEIAELTFQFNNTWWDLEFPSWMHKEVTSAGIRLRGSTDNVHIHHCHFRHVISGVRINPINIHAENGTIRVTDNVFESTGDAAAVIGKGATSVEKVDFLRNKNVRIGMRPNRQSSGHAVNIRFPTLMHVAGNMLERTYGAGLFLFGGKGSGSAGDVPLSRHLIHHNKVEDSLLRANDWGGIETWQGGPFYIYNNISANPGGLWQARIRENTFNSRLGFAYYLDGGFKNYLFNNIAWGLNNERGSYLTNAYAFYEAVGTIHNHYINNTIYRFASGSSWSPRGGHHHFVGNLWSDISDKVFNHGKLKEDKSQSPVEYPHETMAYGPNVFHKIKGSFGQFENLPPVEEQKMKDFSTMEAAVKRNQTINTELGIYTDDPVLRDPANRDMRPLPNSAAIDNGVVHFVPWSLYAMVAEWNFYPDGKNIHRIPDEHWYLTEYMTDRSTYHQAPQYPLTAVNVTEKNYVNGPLETWVKGALRLNGEDQYAMIEHDVLDKPYSYKKDAVVKGKDLKNANIHDSNFILEIYVQVDKGQKNKILIQKMGDLGYALLLNQSGGVTFRAKGKENIALDSTSPINDGQWHHIVAESDRDAETFTIYIDGKEDARGTGIGSESLHNTADLYIGGSGNGPYLKGTLESVRISLGTLEDARTTIDELYTWQFDGPQLRDFTGNKPVGTRDAGALEYMGE